MAFKAHGGKLVQVIKASTKKEHKRARQGCDKTKSVAGREYRDRGVTHPFASARAALRGMRRQQGGPGITEGQNPQARYPDQDYWASPDRWVDVAFDAQPDLQL